MAKTFSPASEGRHFERKKSGPKPQYQPPTAKDLAELALALRRAEQDANRGDYPIAYGRLQVRVAHLLNFLCRSCGSPTDGKSPLCEECENQPFRGTARNR